MTTSQKRKFNPISVQINSTSEPILPSNSEKLLGVTIHEDLKWAEHIMHSDKTLISQLNTRINALILCTKFAPFKTRLMIGNGLFLSKLVYVMPLWSGCEQYLLNALQIIQNKAARAITKCDNYTPIKSLLKQCGWLSVRQLGEYHSAVLMYKTLASEYPKYMYGKMVSNFAYKTRGADSKFLSGPQFDWNKHLTEVSYRWKASKSWNSIPHNIRTIPKLSQFKTKLKEWIAGNIEI